MGERKAESHRASLYHRLANCYEPLFAHFFRDRARAAIEECRIPPGAKVLEIGVGTGLSLAAYPPHADVTGCDLATEMLEQAQSKVESEGWNHIRLVRMDALNLTFPDETFDYVMAFHVVTVVPDPRKLISEMVRVAKPGAKLVIINHFRSHRPWLASFIDALDPVTRHLGWRTTLSLSDAIEGMPVRIEERFKTAYHSLFTVVTLRKASDPVRSVVPKPSIRRIKPSRKRPVKAS